MRMREPPRPRWVRESPYAPWYAVGAVCIGSFMSQVDASIVTLTFHALHRDFDEPLGTVQWVSLSYLLTIVALLAPVGRLSDAIGRKLVYLIGFAVFTISSAACGMSSSLELLVLFRVIQAAGAAGMAANSVAVVTTSVPQDRLRAALGMQAGAQALGLAAGPILGGLLVSAYGWPSVFWVNVPIGIVAVALGLLFLPRTSTRHASGNFDWSGLALLATATTALLLGMSGASGLGMALPLVGGLIAAGVLAALAFWRRENRAASPLVSPALLGTRAVSIGLFGALCAYLVLYGPLVLVPQLLIPSGHGEARAGLILSALPIGFGLAALVFDKVLPKSWSNRARSLGGSVAMIAALLLMMIHPADPRWIVPLLGLLGLALGVFIPANNATVMSAIPTHMTGTAGGLISMARGLGTAFGVALVTLSLHLAGHLASPASDGAGGRLALAVLTVAAAVTAWTSHAEAK